MTLYIFEGLILPERARLTHKWKILFNQDKSFIENEAEISIIFNQIAVLISTKVEWNVFDLRNVVQFIVQSEVALIGYLKGYAYEVEIRRVLSPDLKIDYVFGIDIPCLENRNKSIDLRSRVNSIRKKQEGKEGIFINLCFNDLVSAMRNPHNTALYCYRAIESLRQHCILKFSINSKNESAQWSKLREIAQCDKESIMFIKELADPIRHGGFIDITSEDREQLFLKTWDIVDNYINNI